MAKKQIKKISKFSRSDTNECQNDYRSEFLGGKTWNACCCRAPASFLHVTLLPVGLSGLLAQSASRSFFGPLSLAVSHLSAWACAALIAFPSSASYASWFCRLKSPGQTNCGAPACPSACDTHSHTHPRPHTNTHTHTRKTSKQQEKSEEIQIIFYSFPSTAEIT